jgi:predicted dehydrogenase
MIVEASPMDTAGPHGHPKPRRIRLGLVGSIAQGQNGALHCRAARLDQQYELAALGLAAEPAPGSAAALRVAPERCYADYREMAQREMQRPDGIDLAAIVSPEHLHGRIAAVFLEAGIDVICSRPITPSWAEAQALVQLVQRSGRLLALTLDDAGGPMVRQARELVASGELGPIRLVQGHYALPGPGGAVEQVARFVGGLELAALSAEPGPTPGDTARVLLRYRGGARGVLRAGTASASAKTAGVWRLRVHGTRSSIELRQDRPGRLWLRQANQPVRLLLQAEPEPGATAEPALGREIEQAVEHSGEPLSRMRQRPRGEAFDGLARLYRDVAEHIHARWQQRTPDPRACSLLTVQDGALGIRFVEAVIESSRHGARWVDLP